MGFIARTVLCIATGALVSFTIGCSTSTMESPGTGGSAGSSTASGGVSATGGHTSTGGSPATGGIVATGGTPATGGVPSTGGIVATGGVVATGGYQTTGGMTATGGKSSSTGGTIGGTTGSGGTTISGTKPAVKKFFGNIDTNGSIRSDFKTMWDQFSPENAGKWGSVQGSQGSFNWNSLDAMYKYTQDNGILFKEHTFCWGAQQPGWVNSSNAQTAVKAWMKAFCDRYPKVAMIDVFNESLHNSPAYKEGMGGAGTSGYDWIANAFKWAREACPNAILLYNDYNTIEYANENSGVIKLVNAIKGAGAPIDGVGCQAHDVAKVSASTVLSYVDKIITQTSLPVYITEMDIGVADDSQQSKIMQDIVKPLWENDNVKGFTYWGYITGATWRANTGLMSSSGAKRPALTWLMSFLGR